MAIFLENFLERFRLNLRNFGATTSEIKFHSVGIANGYGLGQSRGPNSSLGKSKIFLLSASSRPILAPNQSPTQTGREAGHSPISSEVKNRWIYASTPPYVFMA
jgi:hypothetical protein